MMRNIYRILKSDKYYYDSAVAVLKNMPAIDASFKSLCDEQRQHKLMFQVLRLASIVGITLSQLLSNGLIRAFGRPPLQ